ncbi:response regulator transcription factor [Plastoroseomonas arctica]|uniref:Response regulator transcription factor n=1 Tax=Plastoroseomonas arctica TaxID=1509237 RepID=A0AAF1KUQ8_9PROT|nr:response regulator transcription factor [Plastoroseomonas arctica]MBR0656787.1 response regulator transcription factor [Plastoroseomonas arctica]
MKNNYRSDCDIYVLGGNLPRAQAFARYLTDHGCPADAFADRFSLLSRMEGHPPGLVLLQAGAGSPDALIAMLSEIRARSPVPCILHAQEPDQVAQRVHGLENGVDDWIPAATAPREVLARIRAVLRRSRRSAIVSTVPPANPTPPGTWHLSVERRELFTADGSACLLTAAEFDLLWVLVQTPGVPVAREVLSQSVFRRSWFPYDRGLDNLVARLRRKLAAHSKNANIIRPIRGAGYAFTNF